KVRVASKRPTRQHPSYIPPTTENPSRLCATASTAAGSRLSRFGGAHGDPDGLVDSRDARRLRLCPGPWRYLSGRARRAVARSWPGRADQAAGWTLARRDAEGDYRLDA